MDFEKIVLDSKTKYFVLLGLIVFIGLIVVIASGLFENNQSTIASINYSPTLGAGLNAPGPTISSRCGSQ